MGKKEKMLLTLLGAVSGGGWMIGDRAYAQTVKSHRMAIPADTGTEDQTFPAEGVARRDVTVDAIDGIRLHAVSLTADNHAHAYVMILHDAHGSAHDAMHYAAHYLEQGVNVLLPDLRGCGESEGAYIGYGWEDRLDVLMWTHWILRRDEQARIVLHGLGAGAAAALCALPEHIPSAVFAVIADSSYTELPDYLSRRLKYGTASRLPARLRLFALRIVTWVRAGYDIREASPLQAVRRASTPVLFMHGDADAAVPASMCRTLYENAQCARQISIFLNAGHLKSAETDRARYWEHVDAFVEKYDPERL